MTIAFVLGNGRSRLQIDPSELSHYGVIYGCNAIYRDYIPDYLIAVDRKMVVELLENHVHEKTEIWTNHIPGVTGTHVLNPAKGWSSGPTAVWMAAEHGHSEIYMIGFDFQGLDQHTKFNNVYADTRNYKNSFDQPTFYGNWSSQVKCAIKTFTDTTFYRVVDPEHYMPSWGVLPNVKHIMFDQLKSRFPDQKT